MDKICEEGKFDVDLFQFTWSNVIIMLSVLYWWGIKKLVLQVCFLNYA